MNRTKRTAVVAVLATAITMGSAVAAFAGSAWKRTQPVAPVTVVEAGSRWMADPSTTIVLAGRKLGSAPTVETTRVRSEV